MGGRGDCSSRPFEEAAAAAAAAAVFADMTVVLFRGKKFTADVFGILLVPKYLKEHARMN